MLLQQLAEGRFGADPTRSAGFGAWPALDRSAAPDPDQRAAGRHGDLVLGAITVAAFVPLFTMQGVEGQIFGPDGADLRLRAGGRADRDLHRHAGARLASCCRSTSRRSRQSWCAALRAVYTPVLRWSLSTAGSWWRSASAFLAIVGLLVPVSAANSCRRSRKATLDPRVDAADDGAGSRRPAAGKMREILLRHPEVITVVSQHGRPDNGSDASPFSNVELFVPLKPYDEWPSRLDQGQARPLNCRRSSPTSCRASTSISRSTSRTTSRRRFPASKAPTRSRSSAPICEVLEKLAHRGPATRWRRSKASPISAFSTCWASRT